MSVRNQFTRQERNDIRVVIVMAVVLVTVAVAPVLQMLTSNSDSRHDSDHATSEHAMMICYDSML